MKMRKSIGWKIKLARTELRLTQQELAKKLLTSHSVIATWESDKFSPNHESLIKLAVALEKPVTYFLDVEYTLDQKEPGAPTLNEEPVVNYGINTLKLPIIENLTDVIPTYSDDNVIGVIDMPRFLFPGAKFIIRAKDDSCKPDIALDDYCVIKPETTQVKGRIMLSKNNGSFSFLKKPAVSKDAKIIGQVVGIIKKMP